MIKPANTQTEVCSQLDVINKNDLKTMQDRLHTNELPNRLLKLNNDINTLKNNDKVYRDRVTI